MSKVNDGQLDHANREIERIRNGMRTLSELCARRFDILKALYDSPLVCEGKVASVLLIDNDIMQRIRDETDEHEVEP